ncbi:MAG: superinfection exclusion B family protein [Enhydrobacter sp.]|nr:superinfection exclusion B family protein [Enhydrobacter sp.]
MLAEFILQIFVANQGAYEPASCIWKSPATICGRGVGEHGSNWRAIRNGLTSRSVTIESFFVLLKPLFGAAGVVLIVLGGGILAMPEPWAAALGLNTFRTAHRSECGLSLLAGIGIIVAVQFFDKGSLLQRALQRLREKAQRAANKRANQQQLHKLTPDEKAYLAPFIKDAKTMQRFDTADGIAGSLAARRIIGCGAQEFNRLTGPEYTLANWARDYLTQHPELLDGASKIEPRARFREF